MNPETLARLTRLAGAKRGEDYLFGPEVREECTCLTTPYGNYTNPLCPMCRESVDLHYDADIPIPPNAHSMTCCSCEGRSWNASTDSDVWLEALASIGFFIKFVKSEIAERWFGILYQGHTLTPWGDSEESDTPLEALSLAVERVIGQIKGVTP